jgi:hypothetical protein
MLSRSNGDAVGGAPFNFGITGPICARALNLKIPLKLDARGHHDWPVMPTIRPLVLINTTPLQEIYREFPV